MANASILEDRAVIAVNGAEARDFLQGLITNDMAAISEGHAIYAALLTPQGKILFDFFVASGGEQCWLLDCAALRAADLMKRLTLYRLRAKVEIVARADLAVAAIWNASSVQPAANVVLFLDPRLAALGWRMMGTRAALADAAREFTPADYEAHRLGLGVPDSADLPPDQVFALDAGFEELNGVSFKKGCYVGQEVTARMKHRSSARRRFVMAQIEGERPPAGTPIESGGRELGTVATGNESRALALVRLDRLAEAEEKRGSIITAGRPVTLHRPGWFDG